MVTTWKSSISGPGACSLLLIWDYFVCLLAVKWKVYCADLCHHDVQILSEAHQQSIWPWTKVLKPWAKINLSFSSKLLIQVLHSSNERLISKNFIVFYTSIKLEKCLPSCKYFEEIIIKINKIINMRQYTCFIIIINKIDYNYQLF